MKKNITTLLLVLCSIVVFSQNTLEKDKWEKYTSPSTNNYFYHHFNKYLTPEIISKEKFTKSKKKIFVEFNLVDGLIENLNTNASNSILKTNILEAFNHLDFNKVTIKNNSKFHNFSIQLIENVKGKGVLMCSSSLLHQTPPTCTNCETAKNFKNYNDCIKTQLSKYLFKNIDSTKLASINNKVSSSILIKIKIDKNKKIHITNNAKNEILKGEINATLTNFNFENINAATYNQIAESYTYKLKTNDYRLINAWLYKTSKKNNLANYFKERIPKNLINQEFILNKINNINISFNIDKKRKPININSSTKNKNLKTSLVNAFKNYPLEKLDLPPKTNNYTTYTFTVIISDGLKSEIECSNHIISETPPIFKGCSKAKSINDLRKCNNLSVSNQVRANFSKDIYSGFGSGTKRIFAIFKINPNGEINDIKVKAPNKLFKKETVQTIQNIKIEAPAYRMGKPFSVKYSLPIALKITNKKKKTYNYYKDN